VPCACAGWSDRSKRKSRQIHLIRISRITTSDAGRRCVQPASFMQGRISNRGCGVHRGVARFLSQKRNWSDAGEHAHLGPFTRLQSKKTCLTSRLIAISSCWLPFESDLAANPVFRDVRRTSCPPASMAFIQMRRVMRFWGRWRKRLLIIPDLRPRTESLDWLVAGLALSIEVLSGRVRQSRRSSCVCPSQVRGTGKLNLVKPRFQGCSPHRILSIR
jgi:hypothetical protein